MEGGPTFGKTTGSTMTVEEGLKLRNQRDAVCKVSQLMVQYRWNRVLIFKVFKREDVEHILNIPISLAERGDSLIWKHCKTGQYTVASGFKHLQQKMRKRREESNKREGCSYQQTDRKLWKALWKLPIKYKLKIFVWKCINNGIPTKAQIFHRTQRGEPICCGCGEKEESIEHMLLQCTIAKGIWKFALVNWDGLEDQTGYFKQWWTSMMMHTRTRREGDDHIALTVNVLWQIWKSRNARIFNSAQQHPLKVSEKAAKEWKEYQEAIQQRPRKSTTETIRQEENNQRQQTNSEVVTLKLATQHQNGNKSFGIGITAVNGASQGIVAWSLKERQAGNKAQDNAEAVRLCMIKAATKGWRDIKIRIEDRKLLDQIRAGNARSVESAIIIEDIQQMTSWFRMCFFDRLNEDIDSLCYSLSKIALLNFCDMEWNYSTPDC
ncbi:uncharacterized protein LOC113755889 [Coffea eugenioides]|uniref:uncharacterized protein LOC113755889 n=1 Tax=Coffea eugenioides TaxID=49369 RepID=UPI000F60B594|nr:uncharacterized protein LOC113755889 [Coffea eugenioides]